MTSYRMPAEWELHEATWLAWPTHKATWPGKILKEVEDIYFRMISALLPAEMVHLLVPDTRTGRRVLGKLESKKARTGNLVLHTVKTVDSWIRDYGPIFVKRQTADRRPQTADKGSQSSVSSLQSPVCSPQSNVAFCKFTFNAWGGKYKDLARDNRVVDRVGYLKSFRRFDIPMVLEGGSVEVNGRGTCLTTEQCLLNSNRNPRLGRAGIEERIKKNLGVSKIIWLKNGIEGDDTDGHVDDVTRFVGPRTILTAVEPDRKDKNHSPLSENLRILRGSTDQDGKKFRLVELVMPGRVETKKGRPFDTAQGIRLPASYANFYIGNHAVLVPTYSHRNDPEALKTIKSLFEGRAIIGIECTGLVYGLGSIHCVTQQQPA
jgi:agmatine deiminase